MQAIATALLLQIHIPVPDEIRAATQAENALASEALKAFPNHAATLIRVQDGAAYLSFLETIDMAAAREELNRKAKKLGMSPLPGQFSVTINTEPGRVKLSCWFNK